MIATIDFITFVFLYLLCCFVFVLLSYVIIHCRKKRTVIDTISENFSIAYPVPTNNSVVVQLPELTQNLELPVIDENIEN